MLQAGSNQVDLDTRHDRTRRVLGSACDTSTVLA
jgi:hypothetical protein